MLNRGYAGLILLVVRRIVIREVLQRRLVHHGWFHGLLKLLLGRLASLDEHHVFQVDVKFIDIRELCGRLSSDNVVVAPLQTVTERMAAIF